MSEQHRVIKKVAILGAGVMGAQIAAHFANASIQTYLFDLPTTGKDPSLISKQAIKGLSKLSPSPIVSDSVLSRIIPSNYDNDSQRLLECDLIIEAISERLDWKTSLYSKITPFINDRAILASNTSGLSINELSKTLSPDLQQRFCGVHFFNPPRYMTLVELIPSAQTSPQLLDDLETFLTMTLGKGVIRAKDTPNFIGNRVGVFSLLSVVHHTEQFKLQFEVVDALTGPLLGRPKSATYRTLDVVGLDTMSHVVKTMQTNLKSDPWYPLFKLPTWCEDLVSKGLLGQKSGSGVFKKTKDGIGVYHHEEGQYRPAAGRIDPVITKMFENKDWGVRLKEARHSPNPSAQFIWACFRDMFHYCAFHLEEIAQSAQDIDSSLRWGYGWAQGPFEIWQSAGWSEVLGWIEDDRKKGLTLSDAPMPAWVFEAVSLGGPYRGQRPPSTLPVYQSHLFVDDRVGIQQEEGTTIFENEHARCWTTGDEVAILSFKTKKNTVSNLVLKSIQQAIETLPGKFSSLVLWQRHGQDFSVGADLKEALGTFEKAGPKAFLQGVVDFQETAQAIRLSSIPVVAALKGMVFGGGCELAMHCHARVAHLETYMGLVEAGVGLLPAGGGCLHLARALLKSDPGAPRQALMLKMFEQLAMAKFSANAIHAQSLGYILPSDPIVMHPHQLLFAAKKQAQSLAASHHQPFKELSLEVMGQAGIANCQAMITNLLAGGMASEHDALIAYKIAYTLNGGDVTQGQFVTPEWILQCERDAFLELAQHPLTQARIKHTLQTGKPLRN